MMKNSSQPGKVLHAFRQTHPKIMRASIVAVCLLSLLGVSLGLYTTHAYAAGPVTVSLTSAFNNEGIGAAPGQGNFDGSRYAYASSQVPSGGPVTLGGVPYQFPSNSPGANDNVAATGQTLTLPQGHYMTAILLSAASFGPANGTVKVTYTDTSTASASLTVPDWYSNGASSVDTGAFRYTPTSTEQHPVYLFGISVPLNVAKTVATLTLPTASGATQTHIFALTLMPSGTGTTAWHNSTFNVDVPNVVRQSDVVLLHPNTNGNQSMPLGNGTLGAVVWAANGFTAQLNRVDTLPNRESPGQVVIPGLSTLTGSANYTGLLDIYDAIFHQSGGGMTATTYVLKNKAEMIVDVTGANPNSTQTAQIQLWSGRSPNASASGAYAALAETFVDSTNCCGAGASGQNFGSLAGITAGGRNVTTSVVNATTVQVSFNPNADGSFRIVVGSPTWTGSGNALTTISSLVGSDASATSSSLQSTHLNWWHTFWAKTGLIAMRSSDGSAQYIENVRDIDLYVTAASSGNSIPGHHNGTADLFKWNQDTWHSGWPVYEFWHWNLRMQVDANMTAGHPELNTPYFNLYNSNLANLKTWTQQKFGGDGTDICVPEIMRFNGNGAGGGGNQACDQSTTTWNGKTLSTGAEVALWMWQNYLYTGDRTFLQNNYPFMSAAARFLLSYAKVGADGKLHTSPSNAHETQWDTTDPTTDIAAMKALFPAVILAAQTLNTDATLVSQLQAALLNIQDYPRTDTATQQQLLTASADAGGQDMIGISYLPKASRNNTENIGLEPVWPYGLIGDNAGSLTQLAQRTFTSRSYVNLPDWTYDAVDAARIGNATDFQTSVINQVENYQYWASGLGNWSGGSDNLPYDELNGDVANATQEALVQDYDGLLRIAPAWPTNWDVSGTVYIQGNSKVDVQIQSGQLTTAVIEAGSNGNIVTRNPWGTQSVTVVDGSSGATVVAATTASQFTISVQSGHAYLIELVASPTTSLPFATVTMNPAVTTRSLGSRTIGVQ